ncbi:hypothetical protein BJ170DRAFT_307743 [Xylariales sp. AK1849]|nr:hypothetical protein BJ170DRAFT_307743 [Xylariales sp. AK1849]
MRHPGISRRSPKGGGGSSPFHGGSSSGSPSSQGGDGSSSSSSSSSRPGPGSSSSSYHGGSSYKGSGVYSSGSHSSSSVHLPWWAVLLIVWGSLTVCLFIGALIYYGLKERKRDKDWRKRCALWKAFCVASGLWFFIWLFKLHRGKKRKSEKSYTKIEEGHSSGNSACYGAPAGPVDALHVRCGTGYVQPAGIVGARYEPMDYSGPAVTAGLGIEKGPDIACVQPMIIGPIQQMSSIPLPTPSPSPAPSMMSDTTAPPPYTRTGEADSGISMSEHENRERPVVQMPPLVSHPVPPTAGSRYT